MDFERVANMSETKLSDDMLAEAISTLAEWRLAGTGKDRVLAREFRFATFVAAMAFVNRLAEAAESAGHHPDIDIRYNRVRLALVTHDAGGITQKDVSLAQAANSLA
jgi:4a-hydroxytetrahydrobiopterin dehydratase